MSTNLAEIGPYTIGSYCGPMVKGSRRRLQIVDGNGVLVDLSNEETLIMVEAIIKHFWRE